jgi:hypothetical protein
MEIGFEKSSPEASKDFVDLLQKFSGGQQSAQFKFSVDLWDKLPDIQNFNKSSVKSLLSMRAFSHQYVKTLVHFAQGLKTCSQILNTDALFTPSAGTDSPTLEACLFTMI